MAAETQTREIREDVLAGGLALAEAVDDLRTERRATDVTAKLKAKLPLVAAGAFGLGFLKAGGMGATMRLLMRRSREGDVKAKAGSLLASSTAARRDTTSTCLQAGRRLPARPHEVDLAFRPVEGLLGGLQSDCALSDSRSHDSRLPEGSRMRTHHVDLPSGRAMPTGPTERLATA